MESIKLANHIKHGATFYTPFTDPKGMGEKLSLSSWAKDWLPEYFWMALVLRKQGRKKGLESIYRLIECLKENEMAIPQMSQICKLDNEKQTLYWNSVVKYVDKATLQPLTVLITPEISSCFYNYFFDFTADIDESINIIMDAIGKCKGFHDELTTDICYAIDWFYVLNNRLKLSTDLDILPKALTEYHKLESDTEEIKLYGAMIRSTFQGLCQIDSNLEFSEKVWKRLGEISQCDPYKITWEKNVKMDYYYSLKKTMEYLEVTNEDKKMEIKYSVVMGITCYIYKLYREIVEKDMQNSIGGRIIFRSMVDSYINLKYLLLKEKDIEDVYEKFKAYGYGKYKLVMAKLREEKYTISEDAQICQKLVELIVNEDMDEAFMNIDVGFFDKTKIKDKFFECDEAALYEIYYEYATNFTHGFWGAIRESSILLCDNPAHANHGIPDFGAEQETRSVLNDCEMIMRKTLKCVSTYIDLPDFYVVGMEGKNG